ncbi:MAG: chlorophyll A-B binding protein [Cyanobacteria bacterium SID2]|nr:chlorophyll A-B binding protein [Cyanobacteria bacterium SID2]MBP0002678.1 chlorophyll A-B binding protein [Cyanobacteria bacterium SBC]
MSTETANEREPKIYRPEPALGWTAYAEQINGRFAMIGFIGLLILEILTGKGLLTWMGIL